MPDELASQIGLTKEFCDYYGISHVEIPGVEADDTIGAIARWAEKEGAKVFLCSSDKDLCQLVSDNVVMINTAKDNLIVDHPGVKKLYNVEPNQIIDYLAIVGDTSDNIPGVQGLGPKAASELLSEFGSLDNLFANLESIPNEKRKEKLKNNKKVALMSKELATIQTNVVKPKSFESFLLKEPDTNKLFDFYNQMDFSSLRKELNVQPTEAKQKEEGVTVCEDKKQILTSSTG